MHDTRTGATEPGESLNGAWSTPQGAPCWVSLLARDMETAQEFYGALLGWEFKPGSQRLGPYVLALSDGAPVAGLGAAAREMGFAVAWTPYFAADDADTVAEGVRERGGTVAVGPVEFGRGRVAWAADPAGALFGIWTGRIDPGWRLGRRVGSPAWIELRTGDAFAAAMFYGEIFGWDGDHDRYEVRYENDRVVLAIDGRTVAGLRGGATESAPDPRVRPRWHVYFCVPDVDRACHHATTLGGTVAAPPATTPYGRVAHLRDPEGALFSTTSPTP